MAFPLFRALSKQIRYVRAFSAAGPSAVAGEAGGGVKMWKILSLFAALPTCAVVFIYSNREEKKHMEHLEAHGRDPFIAYPHLRSRTKKFPWGDGNHSLFHSRKMNPVPGVGYEE